VYLLTMTMIFV